MEEYREHLHANLPASRRICYVAELAPDSTSDYRTRALERLGQQVDRFDVSAYAFGYSKLEALRRRYPLNPFITGINRDLVHLVRSTLPDLVIFDKPIYFTSDTMTAIKRAGAKIVFYVQDNPFGPRNDGCWKLFMRVYRMADLHCAFRRTDICRYTEWGLPFVSLMFSYEPSIHFPPPASWTDSDRDRSVSYIGSPHENRPQFLSDLAERYSIPLCISGGRWHKVLTSKQQEAYLRDGHLLGRFYREAIWRSKINLSFVTDLNEDDIAHKSIEIAASGGFLLALRTPGHQACFKEDTEAAFFSTIDECAEKAVYYIEHAADRREIARRAHLRALQSGYSNDTQLANLLNYFS